MADLYNKVEKALQRNERKHNAILMNTKVRKNNTHSMVVGI